MHFEILVSVALYRHLILCPLQLKPLFPNDGITQRLKVGFGFNFVNL